MIRANQGESEIKGNIVQLETEFTVITKHLYNSFSSIHGEEFARAILKNAPIVVLDEATAFADPENEILIQKALSVLCKDRTVIMIAHRLSTVVNADRIIVLEEGHIIEEGTHKELLDKNGLYHKMWTDYNQAVKWKITSGKEAA